MILVYKPIIYSNEFTISFQALEVLNGKICDVIDIGFKRNGLCSKFGIKKVSVLNFPCISCSCSCLSFLLEQMSGYKNLIVYFLGCILYCCDVEPFYFSNILTLLMEMLGGEVSIRT